FGGPKAPRRVPKGPFRGKRGTGGHGDRPLRRWVRRQAGRAADVARPPAPLGHARRRPVGALHRRRPRARPHRARHHRANPFELYDYPISHSLVGTLVWATLFGGVYLALRGDRAAALVLAAGVASHWVLDVASHRPDMPVLPHGPYVGLGLWYSLSA